ncbi:hypothetical protein LTR36_005020 [Oleoguttula mirabilis]|uniref:2EXR domain-containing protein n=1 Tax=Oleoguttula mirabilis TaxID=1507867 RepID=A0AAV9JVG0_9PEZI|nr:hypothetical protein LTR36_005020 [Oleoguttula mirabilis]
MASGDAAIAPFFKLPGELRNRIYRLVLIDDDLIQVEKEGFEEPPVLLVCHDIRSEALPIYYCENHFCLCVKSFNPTVALCWTRKIRELKKHYNISLPITVDMDMYANWSNLILWLQRLHTGDIFAGLDYDTTDGVEDYTIVVMMRQVEDLRSLPWTHVGKAMGHFRKLLSEHHDGDWAMDEGQRTDGGV